MENEFIPHKEALALKELGFDVECFGCYTKDKELSLDYSTNKGEPHYFQDCAAPIYQQAFRWFREKYEIIHMIYKVKNDYVFGFEEIGGFHNNSTYEEAELACLRKLIKIVNQNKEDE